MRLIKPSIAAAIVPEYVTSSPTLQPLLIPDRIKSGLLSFKTLLIPIATQSLGVPLTQNVFSSYFLSVNSF